MLLRAFSDLAIFTVDKFPPKAINWEIACKACLFDMLTRCTGWMNRIKEPVFVTSQVVSAAKRLRISHLLDAYGDLLTHKQSTFLRHYYEKDLSFGEIAQEYNVSRQAIFDSVRHGEQALEHFEEHLHLVESGFARLIDEGFGVSTLVERLGDLRRRLQAAPDFADRTRAINQLDELIGQLGEESPPLRPSREDPSASV